MPLQVPNITSASDHASIPHFLPEYHWARMLPARDIRRHAIGSIMRYGTLNGPWGISPKRCGRRPI